MFFERINTECKIKNVKKIIDYINMFIIYLKIINSRIIAYAIS